MSRKKRGYAKTHSRDLMKGKEEERKETKEEFIKRFHKQVEEEEKRERDRSK